MPARTSRRRRLRISLVLTSALAGLAGACSLPVSPECETYIACQEHYDTEENRDPRQINLFRADGVCWESTELADECTDTCIERTIENRDLLVEGGKDPGPCE